MESLPEVNKGMVEGSKVGKENSEGFLITEMGVRFDAIDNMFDPVYGPANGSVGAVFAK